MKKKRIILMLCCFAFAVVLCMGLTACGGSDNEPAEDAQQEQEEAMDEVEDQEMQNVPEEEAEEIEAAFEEEENAEEAAVDTNRKYEDFVGTWETKTELADDSFGGYKITFRKNKTFHAVVTGEEESGKCSFENGVVTVQNDVMNDQFWFNNEGIMVIRSEKDAMAVLNRTNE